MSLAAANKLESPSAERNKLPIWEQVFENHLFVLLEKEAKNGGDDDDAEAEIPPLRILEVAAGSGVHTQFFGQRLAERLTTQSRIGGIANVHWQSTDPDLSSLASQQAYIDEAHATCAGKVLFAKPLPLTLDTSGICQADTDAALAEASLDWMFNINMIHISPWSATQGLMKIAGSKLKPSTGRLVLYGPYRVNGTMVESNVYVPRCRWMTQFINNDSVHVVIRYQSLSFLLLVHLRTSATLISFCRPRIPLTAYEIWKMW